VISPGGRLDLGNSDLLTSTPVAAIRSYLQSANTANTDWSGAGLTSSLAAANPTKYSIGYAHAGDASNPIATLDAGTTLVRPTLTGDADLDGKVNFFDIAQLLGYRYNAGGTTATYTDGDLNYDGVVDFFDLTILLSANYNTGQQYPGVQSSGAAAEPPAGTQSVPEPTDRVMLWLAGLGLGLCGRQRGDRQLERRKCSPLP
jgi:hypothetical protein